MTKHDCNAAILRIPKHQQTTIAVIVDSQMVVNSGIRLGDPQRYKLLKTVADYEIHLFREYQEQCASGNVLSKQVINSTFLDKLKDLLIIKDYLLH